MIIAKKSTLTGGDMLKADYDPDDNKLVRLAAGIPSDDVLASDATVYSTTSHSYIRKKTFTLTVGSGLAFAKIRVKADLKGEYYAAAAKLQIYKNNVSVGVSGYFSEGGSSYVQKTADIDALFEDGDTVEFWLLSSTAGTVTVFMKNLEVDAIAGNPDDISFSAV